VVGKRLRDLDLRKHRLQVLAVEEDGGHEVLPVPHPDTILTDRQHLILYGFLAEVQDVFAPEDDAPTESDS
jgi:Trk K+ transport system NAD-binding subunit